MYKSAVVMVTEAIQDNRFWYQLKDRIRLSISE